MKNYKAKISKNYTRIRRFSSVKYDSITISNLKNIINEIELDCPSNNKFNAHKLNTLSYYKRFKRTGYKIFDKISRYNYKLIRDKLSNFKRR